MGEIVSDLDAKFFMAMVDDESNNPLVIGLDVIC